MSVDGGPRLPSGNRYAVGCLARPSGCGLGTTTEGERAGKTSTKGHGGKEGLTTEFTDDKKGGEWRVARVQGASAVQTEDTCRMNGRVNHGIHRLHG